MCWVTLNGIHSALRKWLLKWIQIFLNVNRKRVFLFSWVKVWGIKGLKYKSSVSVWELLSFVVALIPKVPNLESSNLLSGIVSENVSILKWLCLLLLWQFMEPIWSSSLSCYCFWNPVTVCYHTVKNVSYKNVSYSQKCSQECFSCCVLF